ILKRLIRNRGGGAHRRLLREIRVTIRRGTLVTSRSRAGAVRCPLTLSCAKRAATTGGLQCSLDNPDTWCEPNAHITSGYILSVCRRRDGKVIRRRELLAQADERRLGRENRKRRKIALEPPREQPRGQRSRRGLSQLSGRDRLDEICVEAKDASGEL